MTMGNSDDVGCKVDRSGLVRRAERVEVRIGVYRALKRNIPVLKFLFRLIAVLVILLVVLVGGLFLISGERLAKIAGDQITTLAGRDVSLTGSLRPQIFPNLGVRTGGFEVAGTTGDAPLISGEALSVSVDLWSLLSGNVDVQEITLVKPVVTLVKDADGQTNWSEGAAETATDDSAASTELPEIALNALSIQDGTLTYSDATTGTDIAIDALNVMAAMPSPDAPLSVETTFEMGGQAASANLSVASLGDLLAGQATALELTSQAGQNTFSFSGTASTDGELDGNFATSLPAPGVLVALGGGADPALPPEILPIEAAGALSVGPDQIDLSGGSYRFGDNRLNGPISVKLTETPYINATLAADALSLSFLTAEEGSATEPAAGTGWSKDPIDASAVGLFDANIQIDANQVDLGATEMRDVALSINVENARAVAEIQRAQAFGGALNGRFVVNNRNGLSVGGAMDGRTVAIQALLTDLAGFDRMRGAGNTELSFLGSGQNLDQIMRSLSGEGYLDIGSGDITGFDLVSLFSGNNAVGDTATTIFQSLKGAFTIREGVLQNNDLDVQAKLFEARGEGVIDLGRQTLSYTLTPRVFESDITDGFAIPVRIEGPWSGPRIYPDLEFLAKEKLRVEQEKLEAAAKARLEEEKAKIEEKARAKIEEKVQDKLEDELEDKLKKGLGSLFD